MMDVAERLPNNDLSWIPGTHSKRKNQLVQVVFLTPCVTHTHTKGFWDNSYHITYWKIIFQTILLMFILILCI